MTVSLRCAYCASTLPVPLRMNKLCLCCMIASSVSYVEFSQHVQRAKEGTMRAPM